jgi:hypothetical protein
MGFFWVVLVFSVTLKILNPKIPKPFKKNETENPKNPTRTPPTVCVYQKKNGRFRTFLTLPHIFIYQGWFEL